MNLRAEKKVIEIDYRIKRHQFILYIQKLHPFFQFRKLIWRKTQKLKTAINKHGEDLYTEINCIIQTLKSSLDEKDSKNLSVLTKKEYEITNKISEITQAIVNLKKLLNLSKKLERGIYIAFPCMYLQLSKTMSIVYCLIQYLFNRSNIYNVD